jgi:hypothetical protein
MRSSIDMESLEDFYSGNPPPIEGSLIGVVSHPPVSPLAVDHHHCSCCLSSFNHSMRAMLTLVFVFMLFNLTGIWNLPTISQVNVGVMASQASLVLEPGSSFVVMLKKWPHETSPDEGSHP